MRLVASMLVKNELDRYLQASIGRLRDFCDLIAVLDDGSTDRTSEWLDDNADGKMVVKHLDPDDGFFAGHEGRRRQALLDFTLEQEPNYILAIDADEFVSHGRPVRDFVDFSGELVGTLEMREVWEMEKNGLRIRMDGGWRPHPVPILFRCDASRHWTIQDRALACGREPMEIRPLMPRARQTGADILHFGWANAETRAGRYERYVVADGGKYHNRRHLDSIMWEGRRVQMFSQPWPEGLRLDGTGRVVHDSPLMA